MSDDQTAAITIDGRDVTSPRHTTAGALLRLVGLDPAGYDLARVRPGGAEPKKYRDNETIQLHDGEAFVSLRQVAPVA